MKSWAFVVLTLQVLAGISSAQTSVTTHHYDQYRTGWDRTETVLTPGNVWAPNFGLLHTVVLDDQVDAQPLVVPGVSITSGNYQGKHDVVYVATESNTVYAIDADSGTVLLSTNLGHPVPRSALPGQCANNGPNVGITSTPVIDPASSTLYVMSYTSDGPTYRLHALEINNLKDKLTPRVVAAEQGLSPSGTFQFNAKYQRQRPALLLANGNIYAGFGSFCDFAPSLSRGWLLAWNETTLQPISNGKLVDSQETDEGSYFLSSIWMSGNGPAADSQGNILLVTGNSDYNTNTYDGVTNLQESVVKFDPTPTEVMDVFTPSNEWNLEQTDGDFGSGGVLVVPSQTAPTPPLAVAAGKDGRMYLLNEDHLGGYSPTSNNVFGTYGIGACWCSESYYVDPSDGFGRIVSSGGISNQLGIWRLQTGAAPTLVKISSTTLGASVEDPGFLTSVSSNGTAHPIIWAVSRPKSKTSPQINLWAFDPESGGAIPTTLLDVAAGTWPNLAGNANLVPVVANGHVYVASHQQLQIFGLTAGHARLESKAGAVASASCSTSAEAPWTNLISATSPGYIFATSAISVTASGSTSSQCLHATGFKFSIPTTATILGIQVSAVTYDSVSGAPVTFTAQLQSNGSGIGTSQSFSASTSRNRQVLGAWNSLWGATLTPAQINQSSFGVSLQAALNTTTPESAKAYVDDVQITVFYTP